MSGGQQLHPSRQQLLAFVQGRLPPEAMAEVEGHVATCDSCCQQLEAAPEDTLLQLAREAATLSIQASKPTTPRQTPGIPSELVDHPRYRVLGLIGTGGMGAVYKAQHRLMERLVALKVISPQFLQNEAAVERFRREFRAVARLSHPNIVAAYDAEQAGDLHFLVMEFVEGLSLDQLVAQRGPLPVRQACHLIRQAALGLAHILERGMVHRDIKPQNLMVSRQGKLKILDCGLARLAAEPHADPASREGRQRGGQTQAGVVLGTPDYMAPEQSIDAASADIRSDLYSLGCTLYFALTGQPVFPQGSAVEKLLAHAQREPTPISSLRPDLPPELVRILQRMLAKDPAQRYQTPAEVAADLAPLADADSVEPQAVRAVAEDSTPAPLSSLPATLAPELPPVVPAIRPAGVTGKPRRGLPFVAAIVLGLGALAAILLCAWLLQPDPQPASGASSAPAGPPRKVLMVIPRRGLWLADYADVKNSLVQEHHLEVVTASSDLEASTLAKESRSGVAVPDIKLDFSIKAADFGAIVFVGLATEEYHPGSATGDVAGRLLADFRREKRLLTAICGGQKALAAHGLLSSKRVARSDYAGEAYDASGAILREIASSATG
jgi:serine/threonine protein kinase/putative intracellular protease/amidase